ncbi:MAG: tetratricopeptide repeat protein [Candidatus Hodarchaeota archaeon]
MSKDENSGMNISKIKELMQKGAYNQALAAVDDLHAEDHLDSIIVKSRILERKGNLQEALELSNQAISESQINGSERQQLEALINHGHIVYMLGDYLELAQVIPKGEKLLTSIEEEPQQVIKEYRGALAYLKGVLLFQKGETSQALEEFERSLLISQGLENKHDMVESLIMIGWTHLNVTGKLKLAFDYFERSLTVSEELGNPLQIAFSLNNLGNYYLESGNYNEALSYYEKSLALYRDLDNKARQVAPYNNIALIFQAKEKYELALDYFDKVLDISESLGRKEMIAGTYGNIGWVHSFKGQIDLSLDYFQRSLKMYKELGDKMGVAFMTISIGDAYLYQKGELITAIEYFNTVLKLYTEMNSEIGIAWTLIRFTDVYILQGELKQALTKINQSLDIFSKVDNQIGILRCKISLGVIHKFMGNYQVSIKFLEEGLSLYDKTLIGGFRPLWGSFILFQLILVIQELNDPLMAADYLKQIKEYEQESKNKFVKLRSRFTEAIVLKMSKRASEKFQAQRIFQTIIDDEILDHNITVLSLFNLCELFILEIKISDTAEDLFEEVMQLSEKLNEIAINQNSFLLLVTALILQTKIALVRGEFEEANDYISKAKQIASEKQLHNLLSKVKAEQEIIQTELDKWNELFRRKASIQERVERARLVNYITEAKKIQEAWIHPSVDMMNQ